MRCSNRCYVIEEVGAMCQVIIVRLASFGSVFRRVKVQLEVLIAAIKLVEYHEGKS